MKTLVSAFLFVMLLSIGACHSTKSTTTIPGGDNSQTSVDWAGIYTGTIPCASCEGIDIEISLNADKTYTLRRRYKGRSEEVVASSGSFTWSNDGSKIMLSSGDETTVYLVGENKLFQLDNDGNWITGDLANMYILNKQMNNLTEKRWRLTELMGKPVAKTAEMREAPYIMLHNDDKRLSVYGGCNGIGGEYEIKEGNRISFSKLIGTMMACPDMWVENGMKEVLAAADNYSLNGNTMTLNKARMAPLARFEADF